MLPISCTRCHRPYFATATPRPRVRCPICRGRLAVDDETSRDDLVAMPLEHAPPIPHADRGSYREGDNVYASLIDFVNDDPRRGPSAERDIGLMWRDSEQRTYRAAWVRDTGELTLIQHGLPAEGGGHVEVLGVVADEGELVNRLSGWELRCGEPHSAEWLRTRSAERLDEPVRPVAATVRIGGRRLTGRSQVRPSVLGASMPTIG